jgi:hypothetical protein
VVIAIITENVISKRSMLILLRTEHLRTQIVTWIGLEDRTNLSSLTDNSRQTENYIHHISREICPDDCEPVQADMNHSGIVIEWNRMNMWRGNQTRQFYWMTSECADGALRG